jgi:iron complex transport system ATP-binding protein
MGIEFLKTGNLLIGHNYKVVKEIKLGLWQVKRIYEYAGELFDQMEKAGKNSELPDKLDLEKINQAIALTHVEHLIGKRHHEISDGQLQIVLIARALAQDTPLIILDEPTTHLDLFHKVSVFKLLKKLSQETNKCILFSTHDIDLAIQLSDEMIVMSESSVEQDQPCNLITKGIFNTLFKDSSITFDGEKGKFFIN